jgi:ribonuclease D
VVTELAAEYTLPPENLISPDYVRRLAWDPPEEISTETVAWTLTRSGARRWQTDLLAAGLTEALLASD